MLVSNPPRYSEVMNCCVIAVFPTPAAPNTVTLNGTTGTNPKLSLDTVLEVLEDAERGNCSLPDEYTLLELLDLTESPLLITNPFEVVEKVRNL